MSSASSPKWRDYTEGREQHTVTGRLLVWPGFYSPQLNNEREIYVWLPDSYPQGDRRYPVIYMHDGQNLFDGHTSFVGEWQVDETMQTLAAEGLEAIVVGIPNNEDRRREYNPFPDPYTGDGRGHAYLSFIVDSIKPVIDHDFRTLPDRDNTSIAGSSMGGLISLYAYFAFAEVFGRCGAFSPAFWFGRNAIIDYVHDAPYVPGRIYMDTGTQEGVVAGSFPKHMGKQARRMAAYYVESVQRIHDILVQKGYTDMQFVIEEGAEHTEAAWARRLPDALRYLLKY